MFRRFRSFLADQRTKGLGRRLRWVPLSAWALVVSLVVAGCGDGVPGPTPQDALGSRFSRKVDQVVARSLPGHVEFVPPATMTENVAAEVTATVHVDRQAATDDVKNLTGGRARNTLNRMELDLSLSDANFDVKVGDQLDSTVGIRPLWQGLTVSRTRWRR